MFMAGRLLLGITLAVLLAKLLPGFLLFPLVVGLLCFGLFACGGHWRGYGRHRGPRSYYWRGRHGYYGHGCGPRSQPGPELYDEDRRQAPRANTGETTRL